METSLTYLPTEIWLEILELAAVHPTGKDEFAARAETQSNFPRDSDSLHINMIQKEESRIISRRLKLAFVCKSWHAFAIPFLWSHVRLILDTPGGSIENILHLLESKPFMASLVKRLTIRTKPQLGKALERNELKNQLSLRRLQYAIPCLRVISYPVTYELTDQITQVGAISINKDTHTNFYGSKRHFSGPINFSHNVRMLSIDLHNIRIPDQNEVSFPHLEMLHLTLSFKYSSASFLDSWSMPSLRLLSLKSKELSSCETVLLMAKSTLQYLQIKMDASYSPVFLKPREHFPHLETVFISLLYRSSSGGYAIISLIRLIEAPNLRKFGFYDVSPRHISSFRLIPLIDEAIGAFSSLETLCLEGYRIFGDKNSLVSDTDLNKWCGIGLQVKIKAGTSWITFPAGSIIETEVM